MKKIRSKPASVLARLKNVAQINDIDYNAILILYMQERFLYRLSVSPYADNFVLKGGLLLFSIDHFNTRPTLDIDFLAINIPSFKAISLSWTLAGVTVIATGNSDFVSTAACTL